MQNLTPEGLRLVADAAQRHGIGLDAAVALVGALVDGNGRQAQFNHPDLGGMGQWSEGGMTMIGEMFNQGLKARVAALCNDLAGLLRDEPSLAAVAGQSQSQVPSHAPGLDRVSLFLVGSGSPARWWPADLGAPSATGAQNDMRYAFFPATRRLAIQQGGRLSVYDTGEHRLSGFSQQQSGDRSLTFTSQFGLVRVADLQRIPSPSDREREQPAPAAPPQTREAAAPVAAPPAAQTVSSGMEDILTTIERLAELRRKDILTEEEFSAKKSELLARL